MFSIENSGLNPFTKSLGSFLAMALVVFTEQKRELHKGPANFRGPGESLGLVGLVSWQAVL